MSDNQGKFIVFEGLDGSGKSTQIKRAASYLALNGVDVIRTSEPQSDRPVGRLLREILSGSEKVDPRVTASLFAADRLDHLTRAGGIVAELDKGRFVLSDRYYLSNYAYNSLSLDLDWIMELNSEAVKLRRPDLHVFIDVPVDVALERIERRGASEIYEKRELLEQICANYHAVIDRLSGVENVLTVDGTPDSTAVFESIKPALDGFIGKKA